ncbi:MAG: radical SAM/SPASM domain-containing protein [Candidatus Aenigmatarchaeota archaeon]
MKEIVKRLEAWEKGEKPGPQSIQLNPTNRCNLACRFCWQRTNDEIDYSEVSDERYLNLVEEAESLGMEEMEITGGGEPMLRKELVLELMERIKEGRMSGKLITNGTGLDENDLIRIVDSGWDEVVFSVDGPEETHDYLRQVEGCFEETVSSMKKLDSLRDGKPKITFHMVLCKKNYDKIKDTIKLAKEYGCDNFFVEPVVTLAFDTEMGKELKMSQKEIEKTVENLENAKREAENKGLNHNLGDLREELISRTNEMDKVVKEDVSGTEMEGIKGAACYEPWYNMIIRPEGDVGPCCMFDNQGPKIQENSLEEVWFGEYFKSVREKMVNHEMLSFCSKCNPSQVARNRDIRKVLE